MRKLINPAAVGNSIGLTGIVPVILGGTGSTTQLGAASNLGFLQSSTVNTPGGALLLNNLGKIPESLLPNSIGNSFAVNIATNIEKAEFTLNQNESYEIVHSNDPDNYRYINLVSKITNATTDLILVKPNGSAGRPNNELSYNDPITGFTYSTNNRYNNDFYYSPYMIVCNPKYGNNGWMGGSPTGNDYIQIDFKSVKKLNSIKWSTKTYGGVKTYKILGSNDGVNFTIIYEGDTGTTGLITDRIDNINGFEHRYFRFLITQPGSLGGLGLPSIYDINFYIANEGDVNNLVNYNDYDILYTPTTTVIKRVGIGSEQCVATLYLPILDSSGGSDVVQHTQILAMNESVTINHSLDSYNKRDISIYKRLLQAGTPGDDLIPVMTSNTCDIGTISSTGVLGGLYVPYKACDGITSTFFSSAGEQPPYLNFTFNTITTVSGYTIGRRMNDDTTVYGANYYPSEFLLEYSLDGTNWLIADNQVNIDFESPSRVINKTFAFAPISARYWRFKQTKHGLNGAAGSNYIQLSKFQLHSDVGGIPSFYNYEYMSDNNFRIECTSTTTKITNVSGTTQDILINVRL